MKKINLTMAAVAIALLSGACSDSNADEIVKAYDEGCAMVEKTDDPLRILTIATEVQGDVMEKQADFEPSEEELERIRDAAERFQRLVDGKVDSVDEDLLEESESVISI